MTLQTTGASLKCALQVEATSFRDALVTVARGTRNVVLRHFPLGCCGAASEMFALHLWTTRGVVASFVSAERDGETHAWVTLEGTLVDVTVDQFPTWQGDVPYVGPETPLHASFNTRRATPFTSLDRNQLLQSWAYEYELVVAELRRD